MEFGLESNNYGYESLSDDQVLKLAGEKDQLLDEAQLALDKEIKRRNMTVAHIDEYKNALRLATLRQQIGKLYTIRSIGKKFFGIDNYISDEQAQREEFDTTLWFLILWFPVIPVMTVRIRKEISPRSLFWAWKTYDFVALEKKSHNWFQICKTWSIALGVLLVILFISDLWIEHKLHP